MFFELVEIEAHTTSKTVKESLFLVFDKTLVLINDKSELDNFFGFKLVLHERPVGDSTITRDGVEVQVFDGLINVPANLPDRISMLISPDSGHVNWLVVSLKSDIENHDSTIIKTDSQKSWVKWMEIKAHDT
jgi:hypothetical protein